MRTKWIDDSIKYDGSQLKSLYNYLEHGVLGDSAVAWIGPCDIPFAHMADGEDLRDKSEIAGSLMLHFLIEKFHQPLLTGVVLQRLFAGMVKDCVEEAAPGARLRRDGDDLFKGDKKLSISVATVSPVSTLIHFALNVNNERTPVDTVSLQDLRIDSKKLAKALLQRLNEEIESMEQAARKVRTVGSYNPADKGT